MKIIDMRVRAPFKAYEGSFIYPQDESQERGGARGWVLAPSARKFSMEMLIQEADEAGVEKMVVPIRKSCDGNNDDLVELIAKYPDRIIGMAGIDVNNIPAAIEEVRKYVVDGPCTGIILEPGQDKTPWMVNDTRVFPLYAYCQENSVPIFMTYGGIMVPSIRYYAPEPLDDVLGAFPNLKIGLAHGGWPYVTEMSQMVLNRGNLWLAPDFYMIESTGQADYIAGANGILKDRIMFGSAYPLMPLKESSEYYMNSGLTEEAIPRVMYENAAEFLGLN